MDFWKELAGVEQSVQSSINRYNALQLRPKLELYVSLIESSKFAMNTGRTNRAWAYLLMATAYWNNFCASRR